jgi:hypothetical protein
MDASGFVLWFVCVVMIIGLALLLGAVPGWIARDKPRESDIRILGWIGVLVWPCWIVALIWAVMAEPGASGGGGRRAASHYREGVDRMSRGVSRRPSHGERRAEFDPLAGIDAPPIDEDELLGIKPEPPVPHGAPPPYPPG